MAKYSLMSRFTEDSSQLKGKEKKTGKRKKLGDGVGIIDNFNISQQFRVVSSSVCRGW